MRGHVSALAMPAISSLFNDPARGGQRGPMGCVRFVKRALVRALEPVEDMLLSPAGRERIHASATFSLIFLFAVTSVDFLIAGGAEFGAPARPAQAARHMVTAAAAPVGVGPASVEEDVPTALAAPMAETRAARILAVSQNFQLSPFAPPALGELAEEIEVIDQGPSELLALTGEPAPLAEAPPVEATVSGKDRAAKGPPGSIAQAGENAPL